MSRIRAVIAAIVALCLVAAIAPRCEAEDARVTVVTILASNSHQQIDDKLKQIAAEVKKHDSSLTGFRLHNTEWKPVNVGQKESFKLFNRDERPNDQNIAADVTVLTKNDEKQRISLLVKPPSVGEITYSVTYNKFLPIVTRYLSNNERLIIAIMVQPPKDKDAK